MGFLLKWIVKNVLYAIGLGFVLGFLGWFLGTVVLGITDEGFIEMARISFIGVLTILFTIDLGATALLWISILYIKTRFHVTAEEARYALTIGLVKDKPVKEWSTEWIKREVAINKEKKMYAKLLADLLESMVG